MADFHIILSGKFQKVCFENDLSKKCAFYFHRHRLVNDGYGPGPAETRFLVLLWWMLWTMQSLQSQSRLVVFALLSLRFVII